MEEEGARAPVSTPERAGSRSSEPTTNSEKEEEEEEERRGRGRTKEKGKGKEKDVGKGKGKSKEGYHVSLILANSGSVARDHLASERTFLAYVRTSLALASTGVALVQLFTIADVTGTWPPGSGEESLMLDFATPLGSTLILLGMIVLLLGCLRYFAIQTALTRGAFPAARMSVIFVVVTLSVVTGIVFGVLIRGRRRT
ncbi:hypothetical protein P691DRAFT_668750 [Macrolepiota fuliginosa MF-IS2]|uniref:DUF202 domain-containing protein n=1 Tax=Macrolepiota fuliginosa MF-IS2 TaxID=1400762 RepID=A0A9P6C1S9_9AGAR|nr:hypothetical protein P691DRAFT_668750 [Macrolepiota fuliginosa MF-IS2]